MLRRVGQEALAILALVILGMGTVFVFNEVQQLVLARYCTVFFTDFLYDWFHTDNPWILGAGWGIIGSWWLGLPLTLLFILIARVGAWPRRTALQILPLAMGGVVLLWVLSLAFGILGYHTGQLDFQDQTWFVPNLFPIQPQVDSPDLYARIYATQWAQSSAYYTGPAVAMLISGIVLGQRWGMQQVKRMQAANPAPHPQTLVA